MIKEIYLKQISEEQLWKDKQRSFDPDSSPKAWTIYENIYSLKNARKYSKIDGTRLKLKLSEVNQSELDENLGIKYSSALGKEFKIAGDCAFNFSETKVEKFKEKIRDDKNAKCNKDKVERELEKCKKFHHSVLNFSLMPVTGGLNNIKEALYFGDDKNVKVHGSGGISNSQLDRFDTFIYFLDENFKRINEFKGCKDNLLKEAGIFFSNSIFKGAINTENFQEMYNFFCNYKDVKEYCKYFYHIDDCLLNDLKENGKKPICNADDVNNYIKLANRYWEQREKYIESESLPLDARRKVIELLKAI